MSNLAKVGIVVLLALAVGAVVIAKRPARAPVGLGNANSDATVPPGCNSTCCPAGAGATRADLPATQPAKSGMPRLVDLGAGKCIPCKKMAPVLEELKTEMAGRLQVDFIDVWVNPDAGQAYGINIIPTQIFYDASGKELFRHQGFMPKEDILACFKEHGIDLAQAH